MGQNIESRPDFGYERDKEHLNRLAEFYTNIELSKVFTSGAAITSSGIIEYPFPQDYDMMNLEEETKKSISEQRITLIRPEEADNPMINSSNPPYIFAIPPGSINKLAYAESRSENGRYYNPQIVLYHGLDENERPITDRVLAGGHMENLKKGFCKISSNALEEKNIDINNLDEKPLAIVRNALFQICNTTGLGNIEDAIRMTREGKIS